MSIELLEDGVLVEPEEAQEQPTTSDITTDDSDSTTDKAEQEAGEEQHTENDGAAAVSSSLTSPPAASSSSSSLSAAAVARAVDAAESATDQPKVSDSKLDELSVRLPHLPSPFDAIYPRSRGGDRWNKICADGHCMMSELEPGDGKGNVPVLNRVYVNVEGRLQDGTVFLNFPVEELDFTLGQAQVPKGLEMAVCQMSAGQHCLVRCYSDYGYSTTRRPPNVPADALLFLSVRVLRWEKEKNLHEMSLEDKFDFCDRRRAIGKELFMTGKKPRSALKQYEKAVTVLESIQGREIDMRTLDRKKEMLVLFWTNQAQCWMKVQEYGRVVEVCNKALALSPKHVKCLYRRAEARKSREEWDEAKRDYQRIVDLNEEQKAADATAVTDPIEEGVLRNCALALRDITLKQTTQARSQRKRMDGFMKRVSLYDDMPAVSPTAPKPEPEDDYAWLNQPDAPSMWRQVTDAASKIVARIRGWCGQRKQADKKNE